jgi:hypothetical protein
MIPTWFVLRTIIEFAAHSYSMVINIEFCFEFPFGETEFETEVEPQPE